MLKTIPEYIQVIKSAEEAGDFESMLNYALEAAKGYPSEVTLQDLLHDAQADYVNEKLQSNVLKQLIEKKDHVTLHAVYQKLLNIFPESRKLKRLLKNVQKEIEREHRSQKDSYLKSGKTKANEFLNQKKYDEALQVVEELLSYKPKDRALMRFEQKILKKRQKEINAKLELYFKTNDPLLKKEFLSNKKNFIFV